MRLLALLAVALLTQGCNKDSYPPKGSVTTAEAEITGINGNPVRGPVRFNKTAKGVLVTADIYGISPGLHGFHIHEHGDCGGKDAAAAGGHFNPTNEIHGAPTDQHHHVGDLGNLEANANGRAFYEWTDPLIELDGPNSIIGRSVIIHEKPDDFKTQPTGDSGGRIGCGVIKIVK